MFRGMEYVHAVYQEKSISRAAERLCISQPSLSANIKRIEGKVGYPLFDRSTKPLSLTECGEKYIQSIEKIMAVENEFADYVNDWGELKTGRLVLGGSSLFASWVLPGLIGSFSVCYPKVHVELVEESTAELARLLQQGRIDMMLDNCKLDPLLFDHTIYREETLFLAVPRQFPAAEQAAAYILSKEMIETGKWKEKSVKPVPLKFFTEAPFVMLKPENDTRKRAVEILELGRNQPGDFPGAGSAADLLSRSLLRPGDSLCQRYADSRGSRPQRRGLFQAAGGQAQPEPELLLESRKISDASHARILETNNHHPYPPPKLKREGCALPLSSVIYYLPWLI